MELLSRSLLSNIGNEWGIEPLCIIINCYDYQPWYLQAKGNFLHDIFSIIIVTNKLRQDQMAVPVLALDLALKF